ncbi:RNA-binding protein hfq [Pseudanabaena sp. FACHB-2040]|uniref:Hfq-related RNA-binding protein n=1 Tax=Pseudanabaena sp. FACHB-2040 TaxID=2692859 RepID=UPI0016891BAE|nr:RNA-binding protein hfq [Pseudanabaena sp. FACHB-2040]MBD0268891.1 RNA-binding protein hfq [Cyanobacteria bacterium Co-bin8]MBD2257312.1 RNA-binding protein hfq [Pseudanabaena sp. FACHB-2040]
MTTELDTGLPSTRQIQNLLRTKQNIEVKLMTGDLISGQLRWQDPQCIAVSTADGAVVQIWFHAIAYLKPQ